MTDQLETAHHAAVRVRRWGVLERLLVGAIVVAVVVALGIAAFALVRQNEVLESSRRQDCTTRLIGNALGAAFVALAAPPAPNTARTDAVAEGLTWAHRLKHLDRYCP